VVEEADAAASLVRHSHCNDLVVLSQPDRDAEDHAAARRLVERVMLESARPTLLLPCAGRFEQIGHRVLVAWDDSREAARAVADALPLLRKAERVHVTSWQENAADDDVLLGQRLAGVQDWLRRHGVGAQMRVEQADGAIADAMLSRAADLGVDLIVMGAYGHARWTERLLGGATRGLLSTMTVPVLLSH
jgi:nucleotide-binding universal stress UspA family protein